MIRSNLKEYVNQLIALEGGRLSATCDYGTLLTAFDEHRDACFRPNNDEPLQSSLYGLTLGEYRRHVNLFYGRQDVHSIDPAVLRALRFDEWLLAIERLYWLPLGCEKMPYQQVSNVAADCARFWQDAPMVFGLMQDYVEQMRTLYKPYLQPMPRTDKPDNANTRRLYVTLCSTARADEMVNRLCNARADYINTHMAPDMADDEHTRLVQRTERLRQMNVINKG